MRVQAFKSNFPLDTLVCNAATYQPATPVPRYTEVWQLKRVLPPPTPKPGEIKKFGGNRTFNP